MEDEKLKQREAKKAAQLAAKEEKKKKAEAKKAQQEKWKQQQLVSKVRVANVELTVCRVPKVPRTSDSETRTSSLRPRKERRRVCTLYLVSLVSPNLFQCS